LQKQFLPNSHTSTKNKEKKYRFVLIYIVIFQNTVPTVNTVVNLIEVAYLASDVGTSAIAERDKAKASPMKGENRAAILGESETRSGDRLQMHY